MMDWAWAYYEKAKARLYSFIGNLLGLRQKILDMQDRADAVAERARQSGDPALASAAASLQQQARQLYADQQAVEQKVLDAKDKITETDQAAQQGQTDSSTDDSGVGIFPIAVVVGSAAVVVAAVSAVIIHTQRVNYLNQALTDLERKVLSPGEYAQVTGALPSLTGNLGSILKYAAIGGVAYLGYKMLSGSRS